MSNSKFPFPLLPEDLCLNVLKTMEHHEIIAYSFTSKKALSLVQSLRLPLTRANAKIGLPSVRLVFRDISVLFKWKMGENDKVMTTLDDIPVNVDVELIRFDPIFETKAFIWSNQGKNIREWVQHFSSIFRCEWYEAQFVIFNTQLDIQSLRNTFPKLRRICINCHRNEPNHQEIQSIENILKAFLPNVKYVRLHRVPLQENLSIQHIGMTNLKELRLHSPNLKFDDLLTMNVESCTIFRTHFSVRDLNRFFKLWKKGSYHNLHSLSILMRLETTADWNILLKGLNAEDPDNSQVLFDGDKKFIIDISRGYCAQVRIQYFDVGVPARIEISKVQRSSPDLWRF